MRCWCRDYGPDQGRRPIRFGTTRHELTPRGSAPGVTPGFHADVASLPVVVAKLGRRGRLGHPDPPNIPSWTKIHVSVVSTSRGERHAAVSGGWLGGADRCGQDFTAAGPNEHLRQENWLAV